MEKRLKHLDALDHDADGGLILGSSSLTNRVWNGELLYFDNCVGDVTLNDNKVVVAPLECGITDVKWIAGTRRFVAGCDSGAVELWELSAEKDCLSCVAKPIEHDGIVTSISVNSSSKRFISASHDKSITVWDIEEFLPVSVHKGHYDIVWSVAFHASNPDVFISCAQDGRMLVWDLRQPKPASIMETEFLLSLPTCVAWKKDVEHGVAIGTEMGSILLQDCRVGVGVPLAVTAHSRPVYRIAFAPHRNDWLASASNDCTSAVSCFAEETATVIFSNSRQQDFVQGVSWNPVNQQLYTCSWDGTLISTDISQTQNSGDSDSIADHTNNIDDHSTAA
jgi:methylosome protein 50